MPDSLSLTDGVLRLTVRRSEGETQHELDLLVVKLTCEQCENRHALERTKDDRVVPTPEFLQDLASALTELGLEGCTPTLAWQVWIAVGNAIGELKKNMS